MEESSVFLRDLLEFHPDDMALAPTGRGIRATPADTTDDLEYIAQSWNPKAQLHQSPGTQDAPRNESRPVLREIQERPGKISAHTKAGEEAGWYAYDFRDVDSDSRNPASILSRRSHFRFRTRRFVPQYSIESPSGVIGLAQELQAGHEQGLAPMLDFLRPPHQCGDSKAPLVLSEKDVDDHVDFRAQSTHRKNAGTDGADVDKMRGEVVGMRPARLLGTVAKDLRPLVRDPAVSPLVHPYLNDIRGQVDS